jgi:outer membrane protein assembly factor BamB
VAIGSTGIIYQAFESTIVAIEDKGTSAVQKWSAAAGSDCDSDVVIYNTGAYCCNPVDEILISPNGATGVAKFSDAGVLAWRYIFTKSGSWNSPPAVDRDGNVYVGSDENKVYAIKKGGTLLWSLATVHASVIGQGALHNGWLYIQDAGGRLYGIHD